MKIKKIIWLVINIAITAFLRENLNLNPAITVPFLFGSIIVLFYNVVNLFYKVD